MWWIIIGWVQNIGDNTLHSVHPLRKLWIGDRTCRFARQRRQARFRTLLWGVLAQARYGRCCGELNKSMGVRAILFIKCALFLSPIWDRIGKWIATIHIAFIITNNRKWWDRSVSGIEVNERRKKERYKAHLHRPHVFAQNWKVSLCHCVEVWKIVEPG